MIEFASLGVGAIKEVVGLIKDVVEDPDTYTKLEGLRQFLCKLTGREIEKNGLIALLEGVTQGEGFTGVWEEFGYREDEQGNRFGGSRRLRMDGAWVVEVRAGSVPVVVYDVERK